MSNFSSQKQYIYKPKGNESKENDQPHDKENIDLLPPSQNSHWKNCITNGKESLHCDWSRGWKGFSMLVWYIGPIVGTLELLKLLILKVGKGYLLI